MKVIFMECTINYITQTDKNRVGEIQAMINEGVVKELNEKKYLILKENE